MNIKYIIEDNINFYDEINNFSDEEENMIDSNENICLISQKPLNNNSVKLQCGHHFNLTDLYKEVCNQKLNKKKSLDTRIIRLRENEFLCPYCRSKQTKLLPNIKSIEHSINFVNGVNCPSKYCMDYFSCEYIFKSGKNKGLACNKCGIYNSNNQIFCSKHLNKNINDIRTCNAILKSGKNKGKLCGCKIKDPLNEKCKRHS